MQVLRGAAAAVVRGAVRDRSVWGPPALALALGPLLLSPWWVPAIQRGAAESFVLDVGRLPMPGLDTLDLVTGRMADLGAPWWIGALLAGLRRAEVDRAYREAYERVPFDEPDAWGDLASFGVAADRA